MGHVPNAQQTSRVSERGNQASQLYGSTCPFLFNAVAPGKTVTLPAGVPVLGKSYSHSDFLPGVLPASLPWASPNCRTQEVLCLGSSQVPWGQEVHGIQGLLKAWESGNGGTLHCLKTESTAALLWTPPGDGGSLPALSTLPSSLPPRPHPPALPRPLCLSRLLPSLLHWPPTPRSHLLASCPGPS